MIWSSMAAGNASELTMYLSTLRKQQNEFLKRLVNSWGKYVQMYLCLALTKPIALGLNTSHIEIKRNVAALLFVSWASSIVQCFTEMRNVLTLSRQRPISYRNQSIDLLCKSMDWFLYDISLRHERIKDIRIKLDLTKRRYRVLKDPIDLAKEHPDLDYVYVYVNCRRKVVFKDGTSKFFNDIDNLKSMINNRLYVMKKGCFNADC